MGLFLQLVFIKRRLWAETLRAVGTRRRKVALEKEVAFRLRPEGLCRGGRGRGCKRLECGGGGADVSRGH